MGTCKTWRDRSELLCDIVLVSLYGEREVFESYIYFIGFSDEWARRLSRKGRQELESRDRASGFG